MTSSFLLKLNNQNSLKLIGIKLLEKFWLYGTSILEIICQKRSNLTTKFYGKVKIQTMITFESELSLPFCKK